MHERRSRRPVRERPRHLPKVQPAGGVVRIIVRRGERGVASSTDRIAPASTCVSFPLSSRRRSGSPRRARRRRRLRSASHNLEQSSPRRLRRKPIRARIGHHEGEGGEAGGPHPVDSDTRHGRARARFRGSSRAPYRREAARGPLGARDDHRRAGGERRTLERVHQPARARRDQRLRRDPASGLRHPRVRVGSLFDEPRTNLVRKRKDREPRTGGYGVEDAVLTPKWERAFR